MELPYKFAAFININNTVYSTKYACLYRKLYYGSKNMQGSQTFNEMGNIYTLFIYSNRSSYIRYFQANLGENIQLFQLHGKLFSQKDSFE